MYGSRLAQRKSDDFWSVTMKLLDVPTKPELTFLEEKDGKVTWTLDLPGVKKDDLKVTLDGPTLRIVASRGKSKLDVAYSLPEDQYDIDTTTAKLEDGVLYITVSRVDVHVTKQRDVLVT